MLVYSFKEQVLATNSFSFKLLKLVFTTKKRGGIRIVYILIVIMATVS